VQAHPFDHSYEPVFALCLAVRNMMLEMDGSIFQNAIWQLQQQL
jgi:hypothetical protein